MENQTVATNVNATAGAVVETTTTGTAPTVPAATTPATEPTKQTETKPTEKQKSESPEVEKLKEALSRANSQAADYKRQLREKQTEQERAEAERAEADKAMREELETLRKEKAVIEYTNKCLALEFDADLASKTANALADGNMDSVFDCLKSFVENTKTKIANDALNRQPSLSAGTPPTSNTVDTETEQLRRWMGAPTYRK